METAIIWISAIIAVEAITEILVAGKIFQSLRDFLISRNIFLLAGMFSCGYCMSVWVAASVGWIVPFPFGVVGIPIKILVVHRLSNFFHEFMSRWLGRKPWAVEVHKTETVVMEQPSDERN